MDFVGWVKRKRNPSKKFLNGLFIQIILQCFDGLRFTSPILQNLQNLKPLTNPRFCRMGEAQAQPIKKIPQWLVYPNNFAAL